MDQEGRDNDPRKAKMGVTMTAKRKWNALLAEADDRKEIGVNTECRLLYSWKRETDRWQRKESVADRDLERGFTG